MAKIITHYFTPPENHKVEVIARKFQFVIPIL